MYIVLNIQFVKKTLNKSRIALCIFVGYVLQNFGKCASSSLSSSICTPKEHLIKLNYSYQEKYTFPRCFEALKLSNFLEILKTITIIFDLPTHKYFQAFRFYAQVTFNLFGNMHPPGF